MAEVLWDKKTGAFEKIGTDYLLPDSHPEGTTAIDLEIEVYFIDYDWGTQGVINGELTEFGQPYYVGNLDGQIISANITLDSTSDMRTSGSFSIILDENSEFIVNANDSIYWQHVWFRVIKKYYYPNDIDRYPMYNWGDHIGLWNNNGLYASDPSQSILGWFVPNSSSSTYNAETREFNISCTDMLSYFTASRGGHLSHWFESIAHLDYSFYDSINHNDANFLKDKRDVATYSNGVLIEGKNNYSLIDLQYNNYFANLLSANVKSDDKDKVSEIWSDAYSKYCEQYKTNVNKLSNYSVTKVFGANSSFTSTASLLKVMIGDYAQIIPIKNVVVMLQNDYEMLPYDMEFSGDTYLYDMFKKILDLYPRQYMYFDTDRVLHFEQMALAWLEGGQNCVQYKAREFYDLVIEEQWNINLENTKNFTVVWGRDNATYGFYYMTSYQAVCPNCGKKIDFSTERLYTPEVKRICPQCENRLIRLHGGNETYSVQQIGTHKQVIYNDNITTEEEAFNEAKWKTIESCRASKTLTVTLEDKYLSMYQASDKAVGRRIEYKSHLTNETDVYTLLKWTNNFTDGTVTMELEPYYTCADEYLATGLKVRKKTYSVKVLKEPTFDYTVDENGLFTMIINNGWQTSYSLFKIYYRPTNAPVGEYDFWHTTMGVDFLGETCEVYTKETETEYQTKIFRHQFEKSGRYMITCQAWNPNIHPSGCAILKVIEVNLGEKYVSSDDKYFIDEDNKNYIS